MLKTKSRPGINTGFQRIQDLNFMYVDTFVTEKRNFGVIAKNNNEIFYEIFSDVLKMDTEMVSFIVKCVEKSKPAVLTICLDSGLVNKRLIEKLKPYNANLIHSIGSRQKPIEKTIQRLIKSY